MAKTDQLQDFFMQFQSVDNEDKAPGFMELIFNKGMRQIPDVLQFGQKNQQSLRAHTQNVLCFCYQIASIFELADDDKLNLSAAAFLHDINKHPEYSDKGLSYKDIATSETIAQHLDILLNESEDNFNLSYELIKIIMHGHSGHYHTDGDGFFANSRFQNRDILIGIIQAADVLDLSHHFHEKDCKEKALRSINAHAQDFQYEYAWHYFSDNRGIYTNIIHNVIVEMFKNKGAAPLLFYPEGVWYLVKKGDSIGITAEDVAIRFQKEIDNMSVDDPSKLLKEAKGVASDFTQNPFKLRLSAEQIMDTLVSQIMLQKESAYLKKYEKLIAESPSKCFEAYTKFIKDADKIEKSYHKCTEQFVKISEKYKLDKNFSETDANFNAMPQKEKKKALKLRNDYESSERSVKAIQRFVEKPLWTAPPEDLFSPEIEILQTGRLVGSFAYLLRNHLEFESSSAWRRAADIAGVKWDDYPELLFFNNQADLGYRIGVLVYDNGIDFETVKQNYFQYLEKIQSEKDASLGIDPEISKYIQSNFRTKDTQFQFSADELNNYINLNHRQCCHCAGGKGVELMAGGLPRGIKPQLFSNRLKGGGGEPKRNVCKICLQGFYTEKIMHESYDSHYYIHLFADGGEFSSHAEPGLFLNALKKSIMSLQQTDCRSFLIQPNQIVRSYLNERIPNLSGQPTKQWGMIVPKYSETLAGQVTLGINPPGGKESNDSTRFLFSLFYLLIMTRHFNLRGILGKSSIPPLRVNEFSTLYIDHIPLSFRPLIPANDIPAQNANGLWTRYIALYGLRNSYGSYDEKEIIRIAKALSDPTGLDLIYHLKKSYSANDKIKDHPPWREVWQYLKPFIKEETIMPIKKMAEIALQHHFHGKTWKETSQAKPIDLAFDAVFKHRPPESEDDLKMVILHDVTRGLERLSQVRGLKKESYDAVTEFVDIFHEDLYRGRYNGDKNKLLKDQRRIRAAFLGYLNMLRKRNESSKKGDEE